MATHIITGSGAPATTPTAVGQHYIDTVGGASYISVGTTSSADWESADAAAAIAAHVALPDPHTQYAENANNLSDLTSASTARTNLGLGDVATENLVPISKGGTGQSNATAALNNLLPTQSGNSGKFLSTDGSNPAWNDTLPSQTGNSGKFLSTDGSVSSWETAPSAPTGSNDTFTGFDGSGALYSIPGWGINTATDGEQVSQTYQPAGGSGIVQQHSRSVSIDPTANSPDRGLQLLAYSINLDVNSSGFTFGTNGNAAQIFNVAVYHNGTGNTGEVNFHQNYLSLGNGTDPISVRGFSYYYGFGNVNANTTINGPIQGYGFQPTFDVASALDSTVNITAFYDTTNIPIAINSYNGFVSSPIIGSVNNNFNYTGFICNPQITTLTGNAGVNAFAVSGTIGTINSGYMNCVSVNPTVTLNKGYVSGVSVTLNNVTNYAGVQASLVVQDITYTFTSAGSFNNSFTMEYVNDVLAGNESFVVLGNAITAHIESGVSTATQVAAAAAANLGFAGAVTTVITGTASNAQVTTGPTNFAGGEDAGRKQAGYFQGDVQVDGSLSFSGALSIGALSAFASQAITDGTGNPVSIHSLITQPTIPASATVTLADTLGVNTAMLLSIGDNATVTTGFIGMQALGLPAVVSMGTGSTVDHVGGAVFAISLDGGATGGTIAEVDLCSSLGIPNGVTTVTNLRGYFFDLPFGDLGTTIWGLYSKPASAINYMAGSCVVGTSDTPTNSSVGIELNATDKAILNARMTTIEKLALTSVAGMLVFDTTLNQLSYFDGTVWVNL